MEKEELSPLDHKNAGRSITKPAVVRLSKTAGVKRMSDDVTQPIRDYIFEKSKTILHNAITSMEHDKRKTLLPEDLYVAIEVEDGEYLSIGLSKSNNTSFTSRRARPRTTKTKTDNSETTKTHRFKPGTVAIRDIKYQQKNSDSFAIPKANFRFMIRELGKETHESIRYSSDFMNIFQSVIEMFIINLIKAANHVAIHNKRQTIFETDFEVVIKIRQIGIY